MGRGLTMRMHGPLLFLACICLLAHQAYGAASCTDVQPPGNFTCAQQKSLGKCTATWMVSGNFCQATCGVCSSPPSTSSTTSVQESPVQPIQAQSPAAASPSTTCTDTKPPGNYTCLEQKVFGACTAPWMTSGGFCESTCGRCGSTAPMTVTMNPVAENPSSDKPPPPLPVPTMAGSPPSAPVPSPPSPPPTTEYQSELAAAANTLSQGTSPGTQLTTLPSFSLPPGVPVPQTMPQLGAAAPPQPQPIIILPPQTAVLAPSTVPKPTPEARSPAPEVGVLPTPVVPGTTLASATAVVAPLTEQTSPATVPTTPTGSCGPASAWQAISTDPDLSILAQAATALNLVTVLQNPSINFTLFAPVDAAWTAAAAGQRLTVQQLLAAHSQLLSMVFSNIVPNAVIDAAVLRVLPSVTPQTGTPIYIGASATGPINLVSVGSTAQVTVPDSTTACNFVIHKTNAVLQSIPSPVTGVNPAYQSAVTAGRAAAGR